MKKKTENTDMIHTLDQQHSYDNSYQQSNERLKTNARQNLSMIRLFFLISFENSDLTTVLKSLK